MIITLIGARCQALPAEQLRDRRAEMRMSSGVVAVTLRERLGSGGGDSDRQWSADDRRSARCGEGQVDRPAAQVARRGPLRIRSVHCGFRGA